LRILVRVIRVLDRAVEPLARLPDEAVERLAVLALARCCSCA